MLPVVGAVRLERVGDYGDAVAVALLETVHDVLTHRLVTLGIGQGHRAPRNTFIEERTFDSSLNDRHARDMELLPGNI